MPRLDACMQWRPPSEVSIGHAEGVALSIGRESPPEIDPGRALRLRPLHARREELTGGP